MTLAHDVDTRFPAATGAFTTATGDQTFTHTPVGSPAGVALVMASSVATDSVVSGVLYGTATMASATAAVDTGEGPTRIEIFTLAGQAIATGAQTVTLQAATTANKMCTCSTFTSTLGQATVNAVAATARNSGANPAITLETNDTTLIYGGVTSGLSSIGFLTATGTGTVIQYSGDWGSQITHSARYAGPAASGTLSFAFNGNDDDHSIAAVAFAEAAGADPAGLPWIFRQPYMAKAFPPFATVYSR